ncbi:hypothetical protein MXD81_25035, partial [Microbacteriaceae bacterium K1510]|nr:hypothetical protein [Microbacteriaceae bacterium K1510]
QKGALLCSSVWFIRNMRERHFLHDLIGIIGRTMLLTVSAGLGGGASKTVEIANAVWFLAWGGWILTHVIF